MFDFLTAHYLINFYIHESIGMHIRHEQTHSERNELSEVYSLPSKTYFLPRFLDFLSGISVKDV
mgnify:CR=1